MTFRSQPLGPASWPDLERVFAGRAGRADSCWCQRFRRHDQPDNRAALRREVDTAAVPVGLVGYVDDEPVGWTRVQPRALLPGVTGNRAVRRLLEDDPAAWWVTCFVVRRGHRGHGAGVSLLGAAVEWAREHGGSVVDGHPVDVAALAAVPSPAAVFTGTVAMFTRAGFTEIGRTFPSRPIMRKRLRP
ncbi:GNAT family N-acetyltransferase [Amycolatopsis sp. cmx-8-4]|uniref:GNAT family N-acetyltransferase n=1 Tax=Amycolatopsis sp. cmx-8-4 TaxID=2790947 RepID=UPI00397A79FD